jgi:hypothetical protein
MSYVVRCMVLCASMMLVADAAAETKHMLGLGGSSCGSWTKASPVTRSLAQQWVVGYLAGLNSQTPDDLDFIKGADFDGLMSWIDNYCRAHPIESINTAANELSTELLRRQRWR